MTDTDLPATPPASDPKTTGLSLPVSNVVLLLILAVVFFIGMVFPLLGGIAFDAGHVAFNAAYAAFLIGAPYLIQAGRFPFRSFGRRWHWNYAWMAALLSFALLDLGYFELVMDTLVGSERLPFVTLAWSILTVLLLLKTGQIAVGLVVPGLRPAAGGTGAADVTSRAGALGALSEERRWLAEDLYHRSDAMRARSNLILVAIIVLIIGGLVSIYVAGDLVSGDAQTVTRLEQLRQTIDGYEEELTIKDDALQELAGEEATLAIRARTLRREIYTRSGDQSPTLLIIERTVDDDAAPYTDDWGPPGVTGLGADDAETVRNLQERALSQFRGERQELVESFRSTEIQRANLQARRDDIADALRTLEGTLSNNIGDYLVTAQRAPSDVSLLVASGVTRFGILLVVIFLVQILVGVYRYSLRLSAFYAGRADALIACGDRKSDLGAWGEAFTPMDIDFGRQPVTPAQYVIDVVRAYMTREGKADKKAKPATFASTPQGAGTP